MLENVSEMEVNADFPQELKDRILGEARFLRGIHYYNLVLGFGGMPLYEAVPLVGEESLPRTTQEETWNFVISDFQGRRCSTGDLRPG